MEDDWFDKALKSGRTHWVSGKLLDDEEYEEHLKAVETQEPEEIAPQQDASKYDQLPPQIADFFRTSTGQFTVPDYLLDYDRYLETNLWRRIRRRVLKRDSHLCVRCGERGTEVHHLSYSESVLKGEDDSQLVTVCRNCHKDIEFDDEGRHRDEATKRQVLEDRDGPRRAKLAEQLRIKEERQIRDLASGRCFRCHGATNLIYPGTTMLIYSCGVLHKIRTEDDELTALWLCNACCEQTTHDKKGRLRSDGEQRKVVGKLPNVRCKLPKLNSNLFRTIKTKSFARLNALQKETMIKALLGNLRDAGSQL